MDEAAIDPLSLNRLHDEIFQRVITQAMGQIAKDYGPPPCPFSFFVTGSAGRMEQSIWSDQDHGIIFHDDGHEEQFYFLQLGREISTGLCQVGYPYCHGGVMSSNPLWCKSSSQWQKQLSKWMNEADWEATRYLLIFLDARNLFGEQTFVQQLKKHVYHTANQSLLMPNLLANTMYYKKGVNVLGKLLTETHGPYAGSLNIKEIGLFPYVNAVRLIAIKDHIVEASTLSRLEAMSETSFPTIDKKGYIQQFQKLLNYRLLFGDQTNYTSSHYLPIKQLTKQQTKEVKDIIKDGAALYHAVRKSLEKDVSNGIK